MTQIVDKSEVKIYDFRHPYQLSQTQMNALSIYIDNFLNRASNYFTTILRLGFVVEADSVQQITFEEWLVNHINTNGAYTSFLWDGNPGMFFCTSKHVLWVINRMLGGAIEPDFSVEKEFTDVEKGMWESVQEKILGFWSDSLNKLIPNTIALESVTNNSLLLPIIENSDLVVVFRQKIVVNEQEEDSWEWVIPYETLRPFLDQIAAQHRQDKQPIVDSELNKKQLMDAKFNLRIHLGSKLMSLQEFNKMAPGDFIKLTQPARKPLNGEIHGVVKMKVTPGKVDDHYGILVKDILLDEDELALQSLIDDDNHEVIQ